MRILHSADWHLDAPFAGFSREHREFFRRQLRQIPRRICELAIREGCELILLAGDLFDGAWTRESLELVAGQLGECGLPVFISPGNHDFCSPTAPWERVVWPGNVHIFAGGLESVALPDLDCRIWGAGYRSMDCPALLEGFAAKGPERWQLGLLHGDPGAPSSPYCPVTAAQVRASSLDYLALGHIHKAGAFTAGDTLCAWPGCPMGRGFDETGEKGVYLVDLEKTEPVSFVSLGLPRFFDLQADAAGDPAHALEALLPAAATDDVYRVTITGTGEGALDGLRQHFPHIPALLLRDARQAPVELWAGAGEDTLEGVYFALLQHMAQGEDPETAALATRAAELSRCILEGREVPL